jgi:ethanolamine utilization protein EutJ
MNWEEGNKTLEEFADLIREKKVNPYEGKLKCGVDLGTANIVIAVVDEDNNPVAGVTRGARVVRDGIVVDYVGATRIVRELKAEIEGMLGVELTQAATAIPPGIIEGNVKVISNVVESADMNVINVLDEPTAAADVLGIKDGAVVDVGGGTTGISILRDGKVDFCADEPTGGTHMSLVLSGYHGVTFEEAEEIKKDPEKQSSVFAIIRPTVDKMAAIVSNYISQYKNETGRDVDTIYVVGGASCFDKFEERFERETGIKTVKPAEPLLVTPLGIAFNCEAQ